MTVYLYLGLVILGLAIWSWGGLALWGAIVKARERKRASWICVEWGRAVQERSPELYEALTTIAAKIRGEGPR
jgi:hypothetical protein